MENNNKDCWFQMDNKYKFKYERLTEKTIRKFMMDLAGLKYEEEPEVIEEKSVNYDYLLKILKNIN